MVTDQKMNPNPTARTVSASSAGVAGARATHAGAFTRPRRSTSTAQASDTRNAAAETFAKMMWNVSQIDRSVGGSSRDSGFENRPNAIARIASGSATTPSAARPFLRPTTSTTASTATQAFEERTSYLSMYGPCPTATQRIAIATACGTSPTVATPSAQRRARGRPNTTEKVSRTAAAM